MLKKLLAVGVAGAALTLGGCNSNDLRYAAMGLAAGTMVARTMMQPSYGYAQPYYVGGYRTVVLRPPGPYYRPYYRPQPRSCRYDPRYRRYFC